MVKSKATTVAQYLEELPPERREVIQRVREVILEHLPAGYAEAMNWGMISYEIPLADYPVTYNKQPLSYAGLVANKNNYTVYLMNVYQTPEMLKKLEDGFAAAGAKLDMGKSCVHFKKLEGFPLDVIGDLIAATPRDAFIAYYEASRKR